MKRGKLGVVLSSMLCCFILVLGCGEKEDPYQTPDNQDIIDLVTYEMDIAPLLEEHCLRCHSITRQGADRNGAPVNLNYDRFQDAVMWSGLMNQRVQSGTMPPDGALSDDERALFQEWIDDGLLEK